MHSSKLFSLLGAAVLVVTQTTTQILYIPGADTQPLVASIISANPTVTTYFLQCSDSSNCGLDGPISLTEGPKTAAYTFSAINYDNGTLAFTGYQDCALYGTTSAVCVESNGGAEANFPGISTVTYTGTDQPYMPVVITGAAAVSTPSSATATTTLSEQSSISSGKPLVGVSTSAGSGTATKTSSTTVPTSTSAAGGAVITINAKWAVGGGAAAMLAILV